MDLGRTLFLAVGLSMDAFAVSVCRGLSSGRSGWGAALSCGLWFGFFQGLMPLAGFYLGTLFLTPIAKVDHWIACGLLEAVGLNLLKEAHSREEHVDRGSSFWAMLVLALATSVDALAVGISLAMAGNVQIGSSAALIGAVTFFISAAGVKIGSIFGTRFEKAAQTAGGIILILLGFQVLWEHLSE